MNNIRICLFVCCVLGLFGCQRTTYDSTQLPTNSFDDIRIETVSARPLPLPLPPPHSLAILRFDNLSPDPRLDWLGQSLSEMMAHDLIQWPALSVVAREDLGPILREQWLQHQGFSSTSPPVNPGKIQGVRYLVRGGFHSNKGILKVDLQVVDVETGEFVSALSAQGLQEDLPQIEYDLVIQLLNLFGARSELKEPISLDHAEKTRPEGLPASTKGGKSDIQEKSVDEFGAHSLHQIELQLSLERLMQQRKNAYQIAKAFWQEGWGAEIGQPQYKVWESYNVHAPSLPFLVFPIAAFMQQIKIAGILKNVNNEGFSKMIHLESDGFSRGENDESGASLLFFGHIREPRRLFVRAFNEQGELLAVYSKWPWKTEYILQGSNLEHIVFPLWPQPFVSGKAEFPLAWVERGKRHVTFDMVIAPISDEKIQVVLEPIRPFESEGQGIDLSHFEDDAMLLPLKKWIETKWTPPITETLPMEGYLPANKRNVSALLQVQAGKITDVQFLMFPQGTLFSRSLETLKSNLLGFCITCQNIGTNLPKPMIQTIRLQLTLLQDFHAFRFGSRPH